MANKVTWAVLPNGADAGGYKLSLYLTLTLETYVNWADIVSQLSSLQLQFGDAGGALGAPVSFDLDTSLVSPELWATTFPQPMAMAVLGPARAMMTPGAVQIRTPVYRSHAARAVISYPTMKIRTDVERIYGRAGRTPDDATIPGATCSGRPLSATPVSTAEGYSDNRNYPIIDGESTIGELELIGEQMERSTSGGAIGSRVFDQNGTAILETFPPEDNPFLHLYRFYRRNLNNPPPPPPPPMVTSTDVVNTGMGTISSELATNEDPDLHQALSSLGDHPALLRRFGLILDVVIDQVPAGATKVRLDGANLPADFVHERPNTLIDTASGAFRAAPADAESDLSQGMLDINSGNFDLQLFDTDSAGFKLIGQALNFSFGDPRESDIGQELANLRTAGYVVARNTRGVRSSSRFTRSDNLNSQRPADAEADPDAASLPNVDLGADDLLRGFRVDVLQTTDPDGSDWRSLSRRRGQYFVGAARQRVPASSDIRDEGYVKASSMASDAPATPDQPPAQDLSEANAYVHESMFEWSGWSLVVSPPGRLQVFDPATNQEVVQDPDTEPQVTTIKVDPRFKVEKRSLPKLRFKESYSLRARAVDLAGNSLPLAAETPEGLATESKVFRRFEPVPQPVLVMRRAFVEGESLERMVIRTKSGHAHLPREIFFSTNDRHVAPPSTTLDLVIRHGMLDRLFHDPVRSFNLAAKVDGTLLDQYVLDSRTGRRIPVNGVQILKGIAPNPEMGNFPAQRGFGLQPGEYVVHTEERLKLPYLPDPLAVGVTLADIDHMVEEPIVGLQQLFFRGRWPNVEPAKIVLKATSADTPSLDVVNGNLVIRLPPATILDLRYSSVVKVEEIEQMAMWDLTMSTLFPGGVDDEHPTVRATRLGLNWLLQGRKHLVAVHAVERPLAKALITEFPDPTRELEETHATVKPTAQVHGRSTGRVDLEAAWTDPVDRLTDPGPKEEAHTGHVESTKVEYDDEVIQFNGSSDGLKGQHEFGDTKHRLVKYRFDATTRYREYFPLEVTSVVENIMLPGAAREVSIPSSARPARPEVLYIVPTFRWDDGDSDDDDHHRVPHHGRGPRRRRHRPPKPPGSVTSRRMGRGLRVYLARPWYSSGVGELLGVVVARDGAASEEVADNEQGVAEFTDPTHRFISEWGADPIWRNLPPSGDTQADVRPNTPLTQADFANPYRITGLPVSIPELPPLPEAGGTVSDDPQTPNLSLANLRRFVHVVGFKPEFNNDRRVWFADIEMNEAPSNTPFVRLGLVRYQPDSIANCFVSSVVKAEFVQLLNDRVATLAFGSDAISVSVTGVATRNALGEEVAGLLMPPTTPPEPPPGFVFDQAAGAGRLVIAHVERREFGASDLQWARVGDEVVLPSFRDESATDDDFEVLWAGPVPRPAPTRAQDEHRLVIREIELFHTDPEVSETYSVPVADGTSVRGRTIYLDTIPLRDHG